MHRVAMNELFKKIINLNQGTMLQKAELMNKLYNILKDPSFKPSEFSASELGNVREILHRYQDILTTALIVANINRDFDNIQKALISKFPALVKSANESASTANIFAKANVRIDDPLNNVDVAKKHIENFKLTSKTTNEELKTYCEIAFRWRSDLKYDIDILHKAAVSNAESAKLVCQCRFCMPMSPSQIKEIYNAHRGNKEAHDFIKKNLSELRPELFRKSNEKNDNAEKNSHQKDALPSGLPREVEDDLLLLVKENINPYVFLKINQNASDAEIRQAVKKIQFQEHPDKHAGNQSIDVHEANFKNIEKVANVLYNQDARKWLDQRLDQLFTPPPAKRH